MRRYRPVPSRQEGSHLDCQDKQERSGRRGARCLIQLDSTNDGNFLLSGGNVAAVLDFDMSFHGPVMYDIASLIYWWEMLANEPVRTETARLSVAEYRRHRTLLDFEASHILDALKLIVLLGIAWGDHSETGAELDRVDELSAWDSDVVS